MNVPVFCLLMISLCLNLTESKYVFICDVETFLKPASLIRNKQTTFIKQYSSYLLVKGLIFTPGWTAGKCPKVCTPLSDCLAKTSLTSQAIIRLCQRPSCDSPSWESHSLMPPCGAVAFSSNGTGLLRWTLELPPTLVFNITVWEVASRVMPVRNMETRYGVLGRSVCSHVPRLRLKRVDSARLQGEPALLDLCGTVPTQNIIFATEMKLSWESLIPYRETSSFCLSYQPVAHYHYSVPSTGSLWDPCSFRNCRQDSMFQDSRMNDYYRDDIASVGFHDNLTMTNSMYIHVHMGAFTIRYVWLVTGTVVNIPVVTIRIYTCKRQDAVTTEVVQLKVYSCPTGLYRDVPSVEQYLLGEVLHCPNDEYKGTVSKYQSKAGDLTLQITGLLSDQIDFQGEIFYRSLVCPGTHCDQAVYNISTETRVSTSSMETKLQQRILLFPPSYGSGFLMLSNLTVDFAAPTHPLCGWGGIYIYELNPLSLIAKICSPWVAKAWNGSLRREDGTNRLYFNNKPVLFIVKSYSQASQIRIEAFVNLSGCGGLVNPAFQELLPTARVITGTGMFSKRGSSIFTRNNLVEHTGGCFQIQHLLTDGDYPYDIEYPLYYRSLREGRTATHLIGLIRNKAVLSDTAYKAFISFRQRKGLRKKMLFCKLESREINIPKFDLHEHDAGGFVSFEQYSTEYDLVFQPDCLLIGLGQVTVMEYQDMTSQTACLTTAQVEKQLELVKIRDREDGVPLLATTCGGFGLTPEMFPPHRGGQLSFLFNKPGIGVLCCSLSLDIRIQAQDVMLVKSLRLVEHFFIKGYRYSGRPDTLPSEVISLWVCSKKDRCPDRCTDSVWRNGSGPAEVVQPLGRVWTVNSLHTETTRLELIRKYRSEDRKKYILNLSFVFSEWYNAALDLEGHIDQSKYGSGTYCSPRPNVCYTIHKVTNASWEAAKLLCALNNKTLLSTQKGYEWDFVKYLFAKEVTLMDEVRLVMTSFINLRFRPVSEKLSI